MRTWTIALFTLLLSLVLGCHKRPSAPPPPQGWGAAESDEYMDMDEDVGMEPEPAPSAHFSAQPKRSRSRAPAAAPPPPPPPSENGPAPTPTTTTKRMVHYSGYAKLRVARVDEGIDAVSALALDSGGKVERVGGRTVTIRVPVAAFDDVLQRVLDVGDVLDKRVSAKDVTEAFTAVELRLNTARATRDRLVILLAKAEDEEEKLAIVRELQRLSEAIDRMASQSRTLASLAALSRITVELVPREALAWQDVDDEASEFSWIRALSPFHDDVVAYGRKLRLDVPDGMVALQLRGRFAAESPDGTRIWSGQLANDLQADGAFWADALKQRLERDFDQAAITTVGGFQVLRLVERADTPYTWLIAVRTDGKKLQVVEVFYPDATQEQRYKSTIEQVITAAAPGASS